jgi:hypothetical protein
MGRKLVMCLLKHRLRKPFPTQTAELVGSTDHKCKPAACMAHRLQIEGELRRALGKESHGSLQPGAIATQVDRRDGFVRDL